MLFTVKSAKVWQWEFRMCSCAHQASFDPKYLTLCVYLLCVCVCACPSIYDCDLEAVPSVREILAFSMSLA